MATFGKLCFIQETRRRQQAEAAEKRQKEIEGRGVKDPEALKRKQQRQEELERRAETQGDQGGGLRVSSCILRLQCHLLTGAPLINMETT